MGVCRALVGNYLAVLAKGKRLLKPIVFQGATAQNVALVKCFEDELGSPILVPQDCSYMGAIGIAELTREHMGNGRPTLVELRYHRALTEDPAFTREIGRTPAFQGDPAHFLYLYP